MTGLDPRIVRVGLEIGGGINFYEGLRISARGTLYGNETMNPCEIRIDNLTREHRDFILTETSPFNLNAVGRNHKIYLYAGRESYGAGLVYVGTITTSGVSQPPDIGIILNALTNYDSSGRIVSVNSGPVAPLSSLAQRTADETGTSLQFLAQDKNISNFNHTGSAQSLVNNIAESGNVDAYVENQSFIVKDKNAAIPNRLKKISMATGMIGIPEIIQTGIRVKFLFDNSTRVGDVLEVESQLNPGLNGRFIVNKLDFEISSRDNPFYWIAEAVPDQ